MSNTHKNNIEEQANILFGLRQETMGKTQARQKFLPLVNALSQSARAIEITDHNESVAVLVSYTQWSAIISKLAKFEKLENKPKIDLIGSVQIIGNLEAASKQAAKRFKKAIEQSARKLHSA